MNTTIYTTGAKVRDTATDRVGIVLWDMPAGGKIRMTVQFYGPNGTVENGFFDSTGHTLERVG